MKELSSLFGLTTTEINVYLSALDLGEATGSAISNKSHVYRKNTYDALRSLQLKGLVGSVRKNKKQYWRAVPPKQLLSLLDEKRILAQKLIPQLEQRQEKTFDPQNVQFFLGKTGMRTFFDSLLDQSEDLYLIGATGKIYSELQYFTPAWIKRLQSSPLQLHYLLQHTVLKKKEHMHDFKHARIRFLPKQFQTTSQIFIYGDKSGIVVWGEEPLAIVITSKETAQGFMGYFHFLWNLSHKR